MWFTWMVKDRLVMDRAWFLTVESLDSEVRLKYGLPRVSTATCIMPSKQKQPAIDFANWDLYKRDFFIDGDMGTHKLPKVLVLNFLQDWVYNSNLILSPLFLRILFPVAFCVYTCSLPCLNFTYQPLLGGWAFRIATFNHAGSSLQCPLPHML